MAEAEGIPPTASVASVGPGIRYIGKDYCYAFSGLFESKTSEQNMFDFTTGSGYILATLTMGAPFPFATPVNGYIRAWRLNFNGETVGQYKADAGPEDMPTEIEIQILIPPFTAVVLDCFDSGASNEQFGAAHFTGRVYGAA